MSRALGRGARRPRREGAAVRALVLGALLLSAACGKKGPPLAPVVRIPAAIDSVQARRIGGDVYVTFVVPAQNIDRSTPVDIARIEVYGYTGRAAPARARWIELGTLVATVPVEEVPVPADGAISPPLSVASDSPRPGVAVTIRDSLTPDTLVEGRMPAAEPLRRGAAGPAAPSPESRVAPLRRFYLALPYSTRGRPGPPGNSAELTLAALPDPPAGVAVDYSGTAVSLSWLRSGGIVGFLFENPLGPEPAPGEDDFAEPAPPAVAAEALPVAAGAALVTGPVRYNVYLELAPDPLAVAAPPAPVWRAVPPLPLNPAPIDATELMDEVEFGRERCYTVRAVRGTAPATVESEPSPRSCVTPVDRFPPAAPSRLVAVGGERTISLLWEPNSETDLAGYLVLRGAPGDATLQPLTPVPITEARFSDTTVMPGIRYVYAVVAVDARTPAPNVSLESERVEETAR